MTVEQVIRPTGLVDPEVEIRPTLGQMDDLLAECKARMQRNERVLVTTLTKRMAEELTEYIESMGVPSKYLHSDIDTLERMAIIQALRKGEFVVLVGINLLREGLDIPEVSLVAILDADKEGFLRSTRSLIQTFGRAARNVGARVIMYADNITESMRNSVLETERRRSRQEEFNREHDITPLTIVKSLDNPLERFYGSRDSGQGGAAMAAEEHGEYGMSPKELEKKIAKLEREMREAAKELEFERAAALRDRMLKLRQLLLEAGA